MEATWLCTFLQFFLFILGLNFFSWRRRRGNLPPSPGVALPFVGHLYLLIAKSKPLHRSLSKLSMKYGPVMLLRPGNRLVVVVSSPAVVEECFTKNDIVLANRPRLIGGKYIGYNYTMMVAASYGDHWRNLRRLGATEIFSSGRLNLFLSIRKDEIKRLLVNFIESSRHDFGRVEMKSKLSELSFNIIMRMVAGKRYFGQDLDSINDEESKLFRGLITEIFQYSGLQPIDFMPFLRWISFENLENKLSKLREKTDILLQKLIDESRANKKKVTMIDHLISLQESQPEYYTDQIIKGIIMVMLLAGTDTTSVTMEWAMSLLLNHPEALEKARAEIETQVGCDKLIEEQDLLKLPYLNGIISETLRLYPAAPTLIAHESSNDCQIGGYDIPGGTTLLVNAWAIHRDPRVWDKPTLFKPERHVGQIEFETYWKLMPFGMGRRACPGATLAQRVIGLTLGSLIQCFEWERIGEAEIDMAERGGLTMPKVQPLEALCKPRNIAHRVLI